MDNWLKLMFDTLKVFILFTGCTLLFYYGMMWLNQEYKNYHRYDEPSGDAVRASSTIKEDRLLDRLVYFYHSGE